jgi:hypothetical protein
VHIHSNLVYVELEPGAKADGIEAIIQGLYIHYRPGVTPSFTA